ncbi:hypothetical protein AYJ57_19650 [Salipiger sp. CCB-MM3]|nr:hypothetical protein AYJ57_19650 [Salipiger sp. CCB-MM3]
MLSRAPISMQTKFKEAAELMYWKKILQKSNGTFYNGHFERNFTSLFGLDRSYYDGKRMLDIGCGPLGSLEWAEGAARRVGLDPLADKYLELNRGTHKMEYVAGGSEKLPFAESSFDVVSIFNALDHVEMLDESISESQRVLSPGGDLLMIVEINHEPTVTEPHLLDENILSKFDACTVETSQVFAIRDDHNVYKSIEEANPRLSAGDPAIICARLRRKY